MITFREIRSRREFDALEPDWRALEAAGAAPTVFQTWPWVAAWQDQLGRGVEHRTLVFTRWRDVVGIAPLIIRRTYGLPLRRLQWVGTGVSDYLGPLLLPGHEAAVLRAFSAYLGFRANRSWDVADLHQLREDSPLTHPSPPAPLPQGERGANLYSDSSQTENQLDLYSPPSPLVGEGPGVRGKTQLIPQAIAPYRPLPATVEELQTQYGKKLRGNLRYALRTLEKEYKVEFALATEENLEREMETFFTLHARRWRSRWQPGVLSGKAIQAFHRQAARGLLKQNDLRLHVLRLDGETVASLYCFRYRGVGYYYLGGFDPDLSRYSVGTLLTAHAMEEALREGCREFDFLRGQEPYKYRWDCVNRTNYRWIQAGRGVFAALSEAMLSLEQRIADRYEAHAHGGH